MKDSSAEGELGRKPQNVQVRHADWLVHGATTGCAKCFSALERGWGHQGGSHSPECLARYRSIYSSSEEGRLRLERAERRLTRRVDTDRPPASDTAVEAPWQDVPGGDQAPVTPPLHARKADSDDEYEGMSDMVSESDDEDMLARQPPDAEMTSELAQLWSDIGLLEPGGDCNVERSILTLIDRF